MCPYVERVKRVGASDTFGPIFVSSPYVSFHAHRHVEHIPFEFEQANGDYSAIADLGKFDVIILKEILYLAVDHLNAFFNSLKLVGVQSDEIVTAIRT